MILNVDDNDASRYLRTRLLSNVGYEVREAATGAAALDQVRIAHPDLILLDVNLPDLDGFEVCRRIRADPDSSRTPVLYVSATNTSNPDIITGLDSGADQYLTEPLDGNVLIATVKAALRTSAAERALVRSNEEFRRFGYTVAHELREPLRTVSNYSQMLANRYRGRLEADADSFLDFITEATGRMDRLINDMLAFAEASSAPAEMHPTSLDLVLDTVLYELDAAIKESGAKITRDPLPEVKGNSGRLRQVLKNLVGNAIKYRGSERPDIHIWAQKSGAQWIVSISDQGIGISPEYADTVFGLFRRLHGRDVPGSGVGLAVCKEIIERHGGRIWVEPGVPRGSIFRFTLSDSSVEVRGQSAQ
jgi:light-regulated signal transduction histidine kinase (bacteriophytochrome)